MKVTKFFYIFLVILCISCQENQKETLVRSVKVTNPVEISSVTERKLPGIVKENHIINLGFKASGQISQIYVKEGDYVKEGQLLAKLDDKDYMLQVSATEIQYNQLKTEVERLEELYKRNSIAGNDYEKALAGLNALKIQLQGYQNQVSYTTLNAPSPGYIQSINFKKSEMIDAGRPVFTLLDMSSVIIETDLPASLYLLKDNFDSITCKSNLLPGRQFPLKILSISHKSSGAQLYKMYLTVLESNNPLSAGMNVEVSIMLNMNGEQIKGFGIPVNSVFYSDSKQYVWVLSEDSTVKRKEVQVKSMDNDGNMIVTGIAPDDVIISAGVQYLQENEKVNVIEDTSETNVGGLL